MKPQLILAIAICVLFQLADTARPTQTGLPAQPSSFSFTAVPAPPDWCTSFLITGRQADSVLVTAQHTRDDSDTPGYAAFTASPSGCGSIVGIECGWRVETVLPDGRWLVQGTVQRDPSFPPLESVDPHSTIRLSLLDPATGESEDVTPGNLDKIKAWTWAALPTALYSVEHGLTLFVRDKDTGMMEIWQGGAKLELTGQYPATAEALPGQPYAVVPCRAWLDGCFTYGYIRDDGAVVLYDFLSGQMAEALMYREFGARLLDHWDTSGGEPPDSIALTPRVAAWRERAPDSSLKQWELELFTPGGQEERLLMWDSFSYSLDGSLRVLAEDDVLEPDVTKAEGLVAPAYYINAMGAGPYPLADGGLALLDLPFDRVVFIYPDK